MKKLLCLVLSILMTASFSGCKSVDQENNSTSSSATPETITIPYTSLPTSDNTESSDSITPTQPSVQIPMASVFVPLITENELADDGTIIFSHTYQNISLILQDPDIADKVILDFLRRMDTGNQSAQKIKIMAQEAYTPSDHWYPYISHLSFAPTRIDQGILSLFGESADYTGGVHSNRTNLSANYDLTNGDVLTLAGIMKAGTKSSQFEPFILEILDSRQDELYAEYAAAVSQRFKENPSKDEDFFFTNSGLCFYFAPYEIAPYSTGTVICEIPYEKLTGLLEDSYFPAESNYTNGKLTITPFEKADLQAFNQISEAIFQKDGEMFLVFPDDTVQNVTLLYKNDQNSKNFETVFAAQALSNGDAIMIKATPEQMSMLKFQYTNKDGNQILDLAIH